MESALRISNAHALSLIALVALTACDRLGEIVLVPEYEILDSFESGIGAWTVRTADLGTPPGVWDARSTQATASEGERALSVRLDNTGAPGRYGSCDRWS